MNRRTFIAGALGTAIAAAAWPARAAVEDIETLMSEHQVPGLSLATVSDGVVDKREYYGVENLETKNPVEVDTVFEAASLTKPLLALAVMKLWEDGEIDLVKPLIEYRKPNFEFRHEGRFSTINASHVLSHTSGFSNWSRVDKPIAVRFEPGKRFSYSGFGFVLLQRVVEQITEAPFEEYVRQNLFEPLGMESASLVWREDYEDRLAYGHGPNGKPGRGKMKQALSASTLICTADDYAKFMAHLITPKPNVPLSLNPETVDRMVAPISEPSDNLAWGLGWGIQLNYPNHTYWHWGNNGNRYHAFAVWNRATKNAGVVMTNSGGGLGLCKQLVPRLIDGPHPAFDWPNVVR